MKRTYNLYIGASNDTGKVEMARLTAVLDRQYNEGYTIVDAVGMWMGERENSVVVTVHSTCVTLGYVISELKYVLNQDAIGVQEVNPIQII